MPFRRRKYIKHSRRLTKSNILANRSAKAQSKQIAALSRKVNILTKANRPEVLTRYVNYERTFTNASLASNYEVYWWNPWYVGASGNKDYGDALQGQFCKSKGLNVRFNIEYSDSWSGNISQSENHQRTASYRIVILQNRTAGSLPQSASDIFSSVFNASSTLSSSDINTIIPLKSGITSKYKVLYSKAYGISNQHPIRLHNINIPARKLLNFSLETNTSGTLISENHARGTVVVCILTGGLHADSDYTSQINLSTMIKIAFTDN